MALIFPLTGMGTRKGRNKNLVTWQEKEIIKYLQEDLPLEVSPYKALAEKVGMREREVLEKIAELKNRGVLRRVGAVLYHYQAGYVFNAMGCWQVSEEMVEYVGEKMARFTEVSHVYQRPAYPPSWPYNLFTMIHGKSREDCEKIAEKISRETGVEMFTLLYSIKEFKKTSMKYFTGGAGSDR